MFDHVNTIWGLNRFGVKNKMADANFEQEAESNYEERSLLINSEPIAMFPPLLNTAFNSGGNIAPLFC